MDKITNSIKMNIIDIRINFIRVEVVVKRYFQRKTTKSPPIITAKIKPNMPVVEVQTKEKNSSPKSLKRANSVFIELIINKRIISKIISNGVLTIFII